MLLDDGGQVGLHGGELILAQLRKRFLIHHGGGQGLEAGDAGLNRGDLRIQGGEVVVPEELRVVQAGRARAAFAGIAVTGGATAGKQLRALFDGARQMLLLEGGHAPGLVDGDPANEDHGGQHHGEAHQDAVFHPVDKEPLQVH